MALPYELQIQQLLQELGHYQAVIRSCRKEKPRYLEDLCLTCTAIEKEIYELEEKQQLALSQWRETDEQEKTRILFPLTDGLEQMTGIQTIKIPGTVESLGGQAFAGCAGLKEVVMEDGTALLSIKAGAFAGCSSLEKITIPKRATLEDKTFTDFDSVKTIRYTGSRAEASAAGLNKYDFYNADIYYDYKEEHEHKFVTYSYIYTDSCTEPGTKVTKCRKCGEVRSEEEIPAQGHDWEVVSEKKATCKEQGTQNLKCKCTQDLITNMPMP